MTSHLTPIRKVVISEFGDVSKVSVVDATIGAPRSEEVQVAPIYSGFAGADINMRLGQYPLQKKAPLTPGYCLVGKVKTDGVNFNSGDVVCCLTIYDAEAELVNLPEKYLVKVPEGVDLKQATALVLDWATAYGMVDKAAKVTKGQRVFVHCISGAVGYATMKLCQLRGATVYGTASERKHEIIRDQGATPFTYTNKEWMKAMQDIGGADAVFDPLAFESWDESYSILSERGILVGCGTNLETVGARPPSDFSPVMQILKLMLRSYANVFSKKRATFFGISRDDPSFVPNLNTLFSLVKDRGIDVVIKSVWRMADIQEAHKSYGKDDGVGSNLIEVSGEDGQGE
ncbi:Uu.00g121810.m01.CDS01 [Anthostomella pinea]|uniref:Uu.00g121810.m01.CDS01 n=1 Tax=Anthostomella pinea TaxID=933095 RepID=A0AAI8YHH2_9PEZI|nr:Uu.00g121810.m01.CDS01 [Anthostomella pinea]